MSAIYGLVRLDGAPVAGGELETMRRPMAYWGPDGGGEWHEGGAGLGQLVAARTPEDEHEDGPIALPGGVVVTAAGRIDNREELVRELRVAPAGTADGRLIALAYARWGEDAPKHLLGDWSFAAWDPHARRLFLARDHYGNTALYYHRSGDTLAFASSLKGLLALPHVARRLDELQLARTLVLWPSDGAATMYDGIRRLPTAHELTFDASGLRMREFWSLLDVPELRLASDDEYVERLLDLLGTAVRARLRASAPAACTLSAGLDSAAVTAAAARALGAQPLAAYTARPAYPEVAREMPQLLVDEWPLARIGAARYANVEQHTVDGRDTTPLQAIERSLAMHDEPEHAVPNLPWVTALYDAACDGGARVLLTGQMGNGSLSWPGDPRLALGALAAGDPRHALELLRHLSRASRYRWAGAVWHALLRPARDLVAAERVRRDPARHAGWRDGLIAPAFAQRVGLLQEMRAGGYDPGFARASRRERRLSYLLPGRLPTGMWSHQRSAEQGIEMRDPTADVRVLEFCVGVPERQFARDGSDRWLARRAVARLMPGELAWNTRRGAQAADFAYRLRADAPSVTAAVERVAAAPAVREYLALKHLHDDWRSVESGSSEGALRVGRALMLGLFLLRANGV